MALGLDLGAHVLGELDVFVVAGVARVRLAAHAHTGQADVLGRLQAGTLPIAPYNPIFEGHAIAQYEST
jgi:hypothetical protein